MLHTEGTPLCANCSKALHYGADLDESTKVCFYSGFYAIHSFKKAVVHCDVSARLQRKKREKA
jgi:hypothetical protein